LEYVIPNTTGRGRADDSLLRRDLPGTQSGITGSVPARPCAKRPGFANGHRDSPGIPSDLDKITATNEYGSHGNYDCNPVSDQYRIRFTE